MTVRENTPATEKPTPGRFARLQYEVTRQLVVNGEMLAYLLIFALAVLTRFWDLGARVMSHDESLHTRFSWNLYEGRGFAHTPLMHGPLLFHAVALSYMLFGDTDFTSRIYPALLGVIIVMFPIFLRKWLGKAGSIAASVFFLISPLMLYYSRYIRHDIPAILGALMMALAIWRYIEEREFKYLVLLALGQGILYASKEVSFIYIAIFGSFLLLYFVYRLLDVRWESRRWQLIYAGALIAVLLLGTAFAIVQIAAPHADAAAEADAAETVTPADPDAAEVSESASLLGDLSPLSLALLGVIGLALMTVVVAVVVGQWPHLREFPELDVAVAMGTLVLPSLSPFLVHFAGFNPMDTSPEGVRITALFVAPTFLISVLIGLAYFMRQPSARRMHLPTRPTGDELADLPGTYDEDTNTVLVEPDLIDRLSAFFGSRWWAIGGLYWLFFLFFFTTMFTNGDGIGTGVVGSLGYWLEQQDVQRGGQPWYYYLVVMVPMYEYLPLILSAAAGTLGIVRWVRKLLADRSGDEAAPDAEAEIVPENTAVPLDPAPPAPPERKYIDLAAPIQFPVLLFVVYWALLNFVAYSVAGEKMPWLTTHLTTPMILLAGWVTGQLIERIEWRRLWQNYRWVLLIVIPVLVVALLRAAAPLCGVWEANPLCNTVIPESYQQGVLAGRTLVELGATGAWIAAVIVAAGLLALVLHLVSDLGRGAFLRLIALFLVGWLAFLTARSAWMAAFINYDEATEFLVYAHSTGAVKDVMDQIDELSHRTTDGYGLRVAYDDQVSWPFSWYLRDYYNAIYYANEPSRGTIGDAPVIIAGPEHWSQVEAITGNRYYQFEYIRMWWPMQDYFGYQELDDMVAMFGDVLKDPALQRGLWEIFTDRDYDAYADAVAPYRGGSRPSFELSQWPVPDRMRVYIRKDVYTQVWDYGVAASEIAEATDPYAENERSLTADAVFGQEQLNRPHTLAQGPDGLIYVADSANHRIAVYDAEGALVRTFGVYGLAGQEGVDPGVLNEPWGVDIGPDGSVYVADTWNHRVAVFDAEGNFLRGWGTEAAAIESGLAFWGPRDIAIDAENRVYVADTGNKRIMVFDAEGQFLRQIGGAGVMEGQLEEPVGLAIGPDGNLYVADTWNQRVQVFTPEGVFVRQWLVEAWFAESNERPYLDVDEAGSVYVTDPDGSRVIVFTPDGQYLYSFGDYATVGIIGGVLADDEGHLYVVDTENGVVRRFSPEEGSGASE